MENLSTKSSPTILDPFKCPFHNELLEYICLDEYCLMENPSICSKCMSPDHKNHNVVFRNEFMKLMKVNFLNQKKTYKDHMDSIDEISKHLISFCNRFGDYAYKFQDIKGEFQIKINEFLNSLNPEILCKEMDNSREENEYIRLLLGSVRRYNHSANIEIKPNKHLIQLQIFFEKIHEKFRKLYDYFDEISNLVKNSIECFDEIINLIKCEVTEIKDKSFSRNSSSKLNFSLRDRFKTTIEYISPHQGQISDLKCISLFNQDKYLITSSYDRTIKLFPMKKLLKPQKSTSSGSWQIYSEKSDYLSIDFLPHIPNQIDFSNEKSLLAASLASDIVRIWKLNELNMIQAQDLKKHNDTVWGLKFYNNGNNIASSGFDSILKLWDIETGKSNYTLNIKEGKLFGLEIIEKTQNLIVSSENKIHFYDMRSLNEIYCIEKAHESQITKLKSFNNEFLVSSSKDNTVKIWDLRNYEFLKEFKHQNYVHGLCFIDPLKMVVSASDDKTVRIWELEGEDTICSKKFNEHVDLVKCCEWDNELKVLCSAGKDRKIIMRIF